jgi:glycosyltransferase involved in cell wall biosynthesis
VRVLLAAHRYFPAPGGTERIVQTIAEGLVARGDTVAVVTQQEPGTPVEESIAGVAIHRIGVRTFGGIRWPKGYLRFLRRYDADLFHLHGNRIWCADFYLPFAGAFRWPQVLTGHGFYQYAVHPRRRDRWYFERYFPRVVRSFDRYAALTSHEIDQLTGWGFPKDRLTLVPNGVDLAEFETPLPDGPSLKERFQFRAPHVAVYAGGFFENKRVDRLIEAVGQTRGAWALVVAGNDRPGSPYSRAICEAQARSLGVEFRAVGTPSRGEVLELLRRADAVVLGSDYEGFGVILLEAMAGGVPFVSWETGAATDLAATGGGVVVRSVPEFVAALERLAHPAERIAAGQRGRAGARSYTNAEMVRRYAAIYADVAR